MAGINDLLVRLVWVPLGTLLAALLSSIAMAVYWANDNAPPFRSINYVAAPARAGDGMVILREVWRDPRRQCSITYSRWLLDGAGRIHDITAGQRVSPQLRAMFDARTPGRRDEVVMIPPAAAPGAANIVSDLNYHCNPWQALWPIHVRTEMTVEILPP